jgi:hypothetical protein
LQKSALAKAKKAEKALADANKEQILWEEAMIERLRTMSAAAEGKCFALSFYFDSCYACYSRRYFAFLLLLCRFYRGIFIIFATGR